MSKFRMRALEEKLKWHHACVGCHNAGTWRLAFVVAMNSVKEKFAWELSLVCSQKRRGLRVYKADEKKIASMEFRRSL